MDFSEFELNKGTVFFQFTYPRGPRQGEPIFERMPNPENPTEEIDDVSAPVGAMIYSSDSEQFKKHQRALKDRAIEEQAKGGRGKRLTAAELDKSFRVTLLSCIPELVRVGWKGRMLKMPDDGNFFYDNLPDFIEQINEGMADRELFTKASPTS